MDKLDNNALAQLLTEARTANAWLADPVPDSLLRELYELVKWGPTSANCQPMRLVFVRSGQEKERLAACVAPGNVDKVRQAPVTAIVGYDEQFHAHMPRLFPHAPQYRETFASNPALAQATAFRNSSLQGGYLILAARALGLDAGPMSGFDAAKVDAAFWGEGKVRTNFLCALGHADRSAQRPRSPRFSFDEVCRLA